LKGKAKFAIFLFIIKNYYNFFNKSQVDLNFFEKEIDLTK